MTTDQEYPLLDYCGRDEVRHRFRSLYKKRLERVSGFLDASRKRLKMIKLFVQVCYLLTDEKVRNREFGNLLAIPDNFPKLVVSMDELPGQTFKGIGHVPVRQFLLRTL